MTRFRAGFVAVVGRPNVGKSSLINALVGQKVSIVSDVPQTTRRAARGIATGPGHQIVFTDTPGFHKPRTVLGGRLNRTVERTLQDVDGVLLVVDAASGVGRGDAFVAAREVVPFRGPKLCAVNKVDRLRHAEVVPQLAAAAGLAEFDHVVPTSATGGDGLAELREALVASLPEGGPLYPSEQTTDQPLDDRIGEIVREKALAATREEVPHSIVVRVEEVSRAEGSPLTRVSCTILVERESQKGIVIGRGGQVLKRVGSLARPELESLLGSKVFLELRVKVLKEWQRDPAALDRLGF
ncbi:MAG TPA: GTPase Era [Actinomycetota bacterium]